MKNIFKLSLALVALFSANQLFAQTSTRQTTKSPTVAPTVTTPQTGTTSGNGTSTDGVGTTSTTSTTGTTGNGTNTGTTGTAGTKNTGTTGTSQKMAIGDQGTVEDKNTKSSTKSNQITPKK